MKYDKLSLLYDAITGDSDGDPVIRIVNSSEVEVTWSDGSSSYLTWNGNTKDWVWPDVGTVYRSAIDSVCGY